MSSLVSAALLVAPSFVVWRHLHTRNREFGASGSIFMILPNHRTKSSASLDVLEGDLRLEEAA